MRRVPHNTLLHLKHPYIPLIPSTPHTPLILRIYYSSTPSPQPQKEQTTTKSSLWTFLWGANEKKENNTNKPAPIQDILSHKVKSSTISPFEYVFVNSADKLEATTTHLKQHKIISVDCEGVDHSREGTLCLLQIATEKDVFLIDVVALGSAAFTPGILFTYSQ